MTTSAVSLVTFLLCTTWLVIALAHDLQYPYEKCNSSPSVVPVSVSPYTLNPIPSTFCFNLQGRNCGNDPTCSSTTTTFTFQLLATSICEGAAITATFNNVPVPRVTVTPVPTSSKSTPKKAQIISVRSLNLAALASTGTSAQLCLSFPPASNCSTLARAAVGGSTGWSAALLSSDGKYCPTFRGKPQPKAPKGSCQSCLVWDVLGPAGTPQSSVYNFFTRNSCSLAAADPAEYGMYDNCCQVTAKFLLEWTLDEYRKSGVILSGFDSAFCTRTSLRICGTLNSSAAAKTMVKGLMEYDGVGSLAEVPYDITDDMCPMALADSTIRLYGARVGSGLYDNSCLKLNFQQPDRCSQPNKTYVWEINGGNPFPNSDCDDTPGITPFVVDPYMDIRFGSSVDLYCINIGSAAPSIPQSTCGKVTRLDKASFWLMESDPEEGVTRDYRGVYLLTLKDGRYVNKTLTVTWGPRGDDEMIVSPLGLDISNLAALKPQICFEREKRMHIGIDSPDGLNFLWTALYDSSGKCCPTYYSNTY